MAIDALHIVFRQSVSGISRASELAKVFVSPVSVFLYSIQGIACLAGSAPRNESAPLGQSERRECPPNLSPPTLITEYGLRTGVGFVFGVLVNHAQSDASSLLRPMAGLGKVPLQARSDLLSSAEGIGLG